MIVPGLLRSTLLAEGNTDVTLCPHLTWLLEEHAQQRTLEKLRDPKKRLYDILTTASMHNGKQQRGLKIEEAVKNIAENINDFAPLRALGAFRLLEKTLKALIQEQHW